MIGRNRAWPDECPQQAGDVGADDDSIRRTVSLNKMCKAKCPALREFHTKEITVRVVSGYCQKKGSFSRPDLDLDRVGIAENIWPSREGRGKVGKRDAQRVL